MIYGSMSITMTPGKRFQGIEHLKRLAEHVSSSYGTPAQVLVSETGKVYQSFFLVQYESLAQYEQVMEKFSGDEVYLAWFKEAAEQELFHWLDTNSQLYRVA